MITVLSVADTIEVLEGVRNIVITEHLSIFTKVASMLAAILSAWSYIKVSHDYIEGQGVTFWMFAKPLVMVILVCNFNTFVLKPVHVMTNVFTVDLTLRTNESQNSFAKSMSVVTRNIMQSGLNPLKTQLLDDIGNEEAEQIKETGGLRGKISSLGESFADSIWTGIKKVVAGAIAAYTQIRISSLNLVNMGFSAVIYGILRILTHIIYYVQICMCYILLTIYGLVGPFVFAFSIINTYSRGVSAWIARYIHTSFWIPVGQMIFLISSVIMDNINKVTNCEVGDINVSSTNALFANYNIGTYMGIIMICATALTILNVPKICSYIIESAGSGGVAEGVRRSAGSAARAAGKVITKI